MRMKLNAKQKEAVEYLEGPLLVLAGPGTGKTQLLSEKVAYILNNLDTRPENILCMTFTETGAANMRERLKTIIGVDGARVKISTYHAFGTEILQEYKNYTEAYDRKLESSIDEVNQFKIVKNIQKSLPARDILQKDNVKDIISVISSAKSAGLAANDLKKIAEQNIADSEVLSQEISPLLENVIPRDFKNSYENAYRPIYELLKNYTEANIIVKNIERSIGVLARDLKKAICEAEAEEKIKPLSKWKDDYFEKDEEGKYRLKDRIANKKLVSIAEVMAQYEAFLAKNGLFDFDDMIKEAAGALKTNPGFRATLTERYQFILLDEFQDTNPAQFTIIKELTDYEKPLVMAVGDDDQAIYEFQGALATNLTDFQAHYGAHVIALTENYRSTQEILDFSRKIIGQAEDRFADKELLAHKPEPSSSQIYRYEFKTAEMEYGFIAEKIAELVKNGVNQNEIAVISYKHKYFMPLLPYLKAHPEIKIAYEKRDNLFDDEAMHQIFTISRYIYELASEKRVDTSALEILSYRFWGLKMLDVIRLVGEAKQKKTSVFDEASASEIAEIKEVCGFLAEMVARSFTEPLEIFLDELIGATKVNDYKSPFLQYYTEKNDYSAFLLFENLAILRGKLKKHFGEEKLRLKDLIEMLDDYTEADVPISATSPYRDADAAVQILSAHKAKGLEFKYVFILSADHTAWGKGKGNNNLLALPKNLMQIRHTGTTDGEKLRILYVSLTRAKETLYITNSIADFNDKKPDRLEYLNEYEVDDEVISPFLPSKKVIKINEMPEKEMATEMVRHFLLPFLNSEPDMRAFYRARVENFRMSASTLTSFIDIVYSGPQEFFKNYILQAPKEPETENMIFGTLVHTVFEATTRQKLTDAAAIELFREKLEEKDLPVEMKQKLAEKGALDLSIALEKFGNILRSDAAVAEMDFAIERLVADGVPISGKIDHLEINERDKTIEIYDFKTGNYHKEGWQAHTTLFKYMLQLEFYRLLVQKSAKYKNYKIEQAHILFVTPDNDDKVYDKVYQYSDESRTQFLGILKAAYAQIVSLNFLDDPELFIAANNQAGLKDIKKFIELLLAKNND